MSIDFNVQGGIATITINRPERMNAMDAEHYAALSEAWVRVRDDSEIRVAIVTGAGEKAFSAGADLKSYVRADTPMSDIWLTQKGQLLNRGLEVWKPVICAVNGYCLGGGTTLLLGTDIRIAVPHATFSVAEVKRGLIPANGGTQRIAKQLPHAIAMQMLLTGDAIDAATAQRWGLINEIVEPLVLMQRATEIAQRIAANAPLAVQAAKELAIRSHSMDLNTGLRMEVLTTAALKRTKDAAEGAAAFAEKRQPKFVGE